jgi:hypothetical protein
MHGQLHAQALNMLNSTAKFGIWDKVTAVNSEVFAQIVNSQLWISQIENLNQGKVSILECSTWPSDFNAEVCSLGNHRYWHRPESGSRPEGPKSPGMTRIVRDCDRYWMQLFFIRVCRVLRDIPAIPTYTGMKLINMV